MPTSDTAERWLQLCLIGCPDSPAADELHTLTLSDSLDWDRVWALAETENLLPLLYQRVHGRNIVPRAWEEPLAQVYFYTGAVNALRLRELEQVLAVLALEHVPVILLKGARLLSSVYRNPALRPMVDLDLLVREEHRSTVLPSLAALGFVATRVETHAGVTLAYENEITLRKPGMVDTVLEIHWSLLNSPFYQHTLPMDWFWNSAQPATCGSTPTQVLAPIAEVLYQCAHLLLHHGGMGLLWRHDIAATVDYYHQELDWEQLAERAQACNLVLPLQQILLPVAEAWHLTLPDHVPDLLHGLRASPEEQRVVGWLSTHPRPAGRRFWTDLVSMPGWRRRWGYLWSNLLPSRAYMQHRYRIAHPILVSVYYPYRWLVGVQSALGLRD